MKIKHHKYLEPSCLVKENKPGTVYFYNEELNDFSRKQIPFDVETITLHRFMSHFDSINMLTHHKLLDQNLITISDGYVKPNRFSSMLRPGKIISISLYDSTEHFHTLVRFYTLKQIHFMLETYYSFYKIKNVTNKEIDNLSYVRIDLELFNDEIVDFKIYRRC